MTMLRVMAADLARRGADGEKAVKALESAARGWLPGHRMSEAPKLAEKAWADARKSLKAGALGKRFWPTHLDEEPDENGFYWRTIRGHKVPFKKGDDVRETVKKHLGDVVKESKRPGFDKLPEFDKETVAENTEKIRSGAARFGRQLRIYGDYEKKIDRAVYLMNERGEIDDDEYSLLGTGGEASTVREYRANEKKRAEILDRLAQETPEERRAGGGTLTSAGGTVRKYRKYLNDFVDEHGDAYKTAGTFYRATSVDELEKVLKDGGIAEAGDESAYTDAALSASLDAAAMYSSNKFNYSYLTGVILGYEGDSVRGADGFKAEKYRGGDRTAEPYECIKQEVSLPRGTKGPKLSHVYMTLEKARENPAMAKEVRKRGLKLVVNGGHGDD